MYRHNQTYFSRIIGKPGESVSIKLQRINIDDRQVNEPYMKDRHIKDITLREIKNLMAIRFHREHFCFK